MSKTLKEFYGMQRELDNYIYKNLSNTEKRLATHTYNKEYFLQDRLMALSVEVAELIEETKVFKYWKKNKDIDREKILKEYVDVFHFWLSIGQTLGFGVEEVERAYIEKNKENFNRQDNGY